MDSNIILSNNSIGHGFSKNYNLDSYLSLCFKLNSVYLSDGFGTYDLWSVKNPIFLMNDPYKRSSLLYGPIVKNCNLNKLKNISLFTGDSLVICQTMFGKNGILGQKSFKYIESQTKKIINKFKELYKPNITDEEIKKRADILSIYICAYILNIIFNYNFIMTLKQYNLSPDKLKFLNKLKSDTHELFKNFQFDSPEKIIEYLKNITNKKIDSKVNNINSKDKNEFPFVDIYHIFNLISYDLTGEYLLYKTVNGKTEGTYLSIFDISTSNIIYNYITYNFIIIETEQNKKNKSILIT